MSEMNEGIGVCREDHMANLDLAAAIERHLEEQADLHIAVRVGEGQLILAGRVTTPEARQAAEDLAAPLAPGLKIANYIEVESYLPDELRDLHISEPERGEPARPSEFEAARGRVPGAPLADAGTPSTEARDPGTGESGEPFLAPVDPVVGLDPRGRPVVLGGFGLSSLDSLEVASSAHEPLLGDEAVADAVSRELREDAATAALAIEVEVWDGVAHLRGVVDGPEDAEAAEAVAARVPGVVEVADDLEFRSFAPPGEGADNG
jgi:osmotically-inducible protein OsmY